MRGGEQLRVPRLLLVARDDSRCWVRAVFESSVDRYRADEVEALGLKPGVLSAS
jgi:hypothetical protein